MDGQDQQPVYCTNGCGFFGNPKCLNMCSKCYKESQAAKEQEQVAASGVAVASAPGSASKPPRHPSAEDSKTGASPMATDPVSPSAVSKPIPMAGGNSAAVGTASGSLDAGAGSMGGSLGASLGSSLGAASNLSVSPGTSLALSTSPQKNQSRCWSCKKRIGLTGFKCRCGFYYCGVHRYSDKHECSFDYKGDAQEQLRKANPVVQAAKIDKI